MFYKKPLSYRYDSKFKGASLQPRGVKSVKRILASIFIGLSLAPKAIMANPPPYFCGHNTHTAKNKIN